ncbi:hypothetical protein KC19_VG263800 [Ceratodon purpureus]|uniref:Uncharacterized protein n=1 Tax=Ceratodon purpureus TaxID=3225 RepID=A0A8T0HTU9_CERPU|nr:hypothetical protein KC19_VG263800 [Ceratodon purpureus]
MSFMFVVNQRWSEKIGTSIARRKTKRPTSGGRCGQGQGQRNVPRPSPPRTRPSPTLGKAPRARAAAPRPVCPSSILHPGPVTLVERPPPPPRRLSRCAFSMIRRFAPEFRTGRF